jgi:D-alanyl-D-alanine carboxypeptidase
MRKLLVLFAFCFGISAVNAADYNAVLIADMDSGQVLFQENANDVNYPASLTKIMTLYLTFDALEHGRLKLGQQLIVSKTATAASPVKIGLAAGSKISVEDAIKAVTVYSANDIAVVLSENLVGDEGDFATLMTRVATEIGLSKTNFANASGLSDDSHVSTARDMALLAMAVYKHFPQYWKYFSVKTFVFNGKTYQNTNRLLGTYPGCDGMKTGYTGKSKYSLIATAKRDGRHIMSVVLGAPDKDVRAEVSRRMLDKGFAMALNKTNNQQPTTNNQSAPPVPAVKKVAATKVEKPIIGKYGIQFGAFGSVAAADAQRQRVFDAFGLKTENETASNGMIRVRTYGMSEDTARKLASQCAEKKLDCLVVQK